MLKNQEGNVSMYLKRNIYKELFDWKQDSSHHLLEVTGARQAGKTYIVNKFTDEHFRHKIYINLFEQSGHQFLECFRLAIDEASDTEYPEYSLRSAFQLFEPDFVDSDDMIIMIDEVQESASIYNHIQKFNCYFQSRFILLSSYPGQLMKPEFESRNEDSVKLSVDTLSFEEFLQSYNENLYAQYLRLPSEPLQKNHICSNFKAAYDIYLQIGGYPNVVKTYLEKQSIEKARGALIKIINTFTNESTRYFTDIQDARVFTQIFLSICRIAGRKSRRITEGSIQKEIQELIAQNDSIYVSRDTCNRVLDWLYFSGITDFCSETARADSVDFKPRGRSYCHFMDSGLANYYLSLTGLNPRLILGIPNPENMMNL